MNRKLVMISGLVVVALALGVLIWTRPVQGLLLDTSDEAQKVTDTINRSIRVDFETGYTFDASQLATVFINDPRGGELTSEALAVIQEMRQDPTIQKDQVGILDYHQAVIERRKGVYESYMAGLRAKQANGTISAKEQLILDGETYGWPTLTPDTASITLAPTQPCRIVRQAMATSSPPYPPPNSPSISTATPETESDLPPCGPTPVPTRFMPALRAQGRGPNPDSLSPESFKIDILSIKVEGDIAWVVVHKSGVTSEAVLVKVNEQWFIAGAKLLKYAP